MDPQTRPANKVDDKLLQLADSHSAEEISALLGGVLSPKTVASHTKKLLKSKNWLTRAEESQLLLHRLRKVLIELEGKFLDNDNATQRLRYIKEIGARYDARDAATQVDLDVLYGNQAIIMGQAIELALQKALTSLRESYPDLLEGDIRQALRLALPVAAAEIQARTADE